MENSFCEVKSGARAPETMKEIAVDLGELHFDATLIYDLLSVMWTAAAADTDDIQERLSSALMIAMSRMDELSCGIERVWNNVRTTAAAERGAA